VRLERFRVSNFRSVNDSGWIDIKDATAFVGRNESGKTTLLQALASLNGADALKELSRSRDFPADRLYSDFSGSLTVLRTMWSLDESEHDALVGQLPNATSIEGVEVGRPYAAEPWVRFCGPPEREDVNARALELVKQVVGVPVVAGAPPDPAWVHAMGGLETAVARPCEDPKVWVVDVVAALSALQESLASGVMEIDSSARSALEELAELATTLSDESQLENAARDWVLRRLPRFLFLDRYPIIEGNQNLPEFAARQLEGRATPTDVYFGMLLRVAGIDPTRIGELLEADPEVRRQTASRAGAVMTRTLRRIWTDRQLKVRFNIDGNHFNTIVSDPTSMCDVEVNLNQRSRGFRWFFSFYVMLAAGGKDGTTSQAVLLLDEPGMHLHATGQQDLLQHLTNDLPNQVLFTTQSPYMIPEGDGGGLRWVTFEEGVGTTVRNEATLDDVMPAPPTRVAAVRDVEIEDSGEPEVIEIEALATIEPDAVVAEPLLSPLDPALAEAASRLEGESILLVEEITDYWYLKMASDYLAENGRNALPEGVLINPVGGSYAIPLLLAQLGDGANALVLSSGRPDVQSLWSGKTLWTGSFVDDPAGAHERVDLEDFFDPKSYARFVRYSYREQLGEREIELDSSIPRMIERYEVAFDALDLRFLRSAPARTVILSVAKKPELAMREKTVDRFERIFKAIEERCR